MTMQMPLALAAAVLSLALHAANDGPLAAAEREVVVRDGIGAFAAKAESGAPANTSTTIWPMLFVRASLLVGASILMVAVMSCFPSRMVSESFALTVAGASLFSAFSTPLVLLLLQAEVNSAMQAKNNSFFISVFY